MFNLIKASNLIFDESSGRWTVEGHELHSGDCFQIVWNGEWIWTRIEHSDGKWILELPKKWVAVSALDGIMARLSAQVL